MKTAHEYAAVLPAPTFCIPSGGFALGIRASTDEITGIDYLPPGTAARRPTHPLAHEAVRQLRAWLADPRHVFTLPLAAAGTPFQRRVWAAIAAIPGGETLGYGELAARVGSGARAVGNACGANPYPIVVPCHRVVAAERKLGGFAGHRDGWLLEVKRWLLHHECHSR
ncbi:MAG: cysteine methyltransferase [Betaproteobacteria bacterium HGW-Betaproteobacteria-11]|nr:MAG: cysteine methyltransferase [Betaproteobacteria bacterium HGW-Betaproteobacteria-11]